MSNMQSDISTEYAARPTRIAKIPAIVALSLLATVLATSNLSASAATSVGPALNHSTALTYSDSEIKTHEALISGTRESVYPITEPYEPGSETVLKYWNFVPLEKKPLNSYSNFQKRPSSSGSGASLDCGSLSGKAKV